MSFINLQKVLIHFGLIVIASNVSYACRGQLFASGITEEDKRVIMHEHNRLRQLVATGRYPGQPAAENMREIVWDDELALKAQQWADNCEFRHDPHRTINRFTMGQNLAVIWSTAPLAPDDGDFPSRIEAWFDEVQKYSFGAAWSPKTGHYSQLVWGETSLIGCGYSEYKDATKYNKLYVCNYGPGGNVVGYKPYEVGKPSCGTYGMRPSSRYNGLCAAPTAPSIGIFSNAIDTYDYQQTNTFNSNSKKTPASSSSSSSNFQTTQYTKQATLLSKSPADKTFLSSRAYNNQKTISSTYAYTGLRTAAVETGQYHKYRNKLEALRPTPEEFQKAVRKHTILRTYINQQPSQQQQYQQQQQQQQQQEQVEQQQQGEQWDNTEQSQYNGVYEYTTSSTVAPARRGWSLLTWRG